MTILNIHGYNGSSENAAYVALKELGHKVVSPQIDYDSSDADKIFKAVSDLYTYAKPDLIVGTSFGGFFACLLSAVYNVPSVAVNPCLKPFEILPNLGYTHDIRNLIGLFGNLKSIQNDNISAIVGGQDEIIGSHDFTRLLLGNERYRVIPDGKHSGSTLPLNEYFAECISYYEDGNE